jgi:hypothetical protein
MRLNRSAYRIPGRNTHTNVAVYTTGQACRGASLPLLVPNRPPVIRQSRGALGQHLSSERHQRDCRLRSPLLAPQLSSPEDLQLSTDSFPCCHVVSPTMWTHIDEGLRELIDASGALLVIAEGGHKPSLSNHLLSSLASIKNDPASQSRVNLDVGLAVGERDDGREEGHTDEASCDRRYEARRI